MGQIKFKKIIVEYMTTKYLFRFIIRLKLNQFNFSCNN